MSDLPGEPERRAAERADWEARRDDYLDTFAVAAARLREYDPDDDNLDALAAPVKAAYNDLLRHCRAGVRRAPTCGDCERPIYDWQDSSAVAEGHPVHCQCPD